MKNQLIVLMFLLAVVLGCGQGRTKDPPMPPESEFIKITSAELIAEYDANELRADNKFLNKWLEVDGKIDDITITFGVLVVRFAGPGFKAVHCKVADTSKETVSKLESGERVTVVGLNEGYTAKTVIGLNNCVVRE